MASHTFLSEWTDVYKIENGDPPTAGDGGIATLPHQALGNRIQFVKDALDAAADSLDGHIGEGGTDQHPIVTGLSAGFMSPAQLAILQQAVPPGAVLPFARATAPDGWFKCNGATASRTAYPELFAAIGTVFGAGDGSTTFGLPELRAEYVRGLDDSRGIDAGRTLGSWKSGSLIVGDFNGDSQVGAFTGALAVGTTDKNAFGLDPLTAADYPNATATSATGGGPGFGLYPPATSPSVYGVARTRSVALLYCIKY